MLQTTLNVAREYGWGCFLCDKLVVKNSLPRIEDILETLSNSASLGAILLHVLKKMLFAYKERLIKESRKIA